MRYLAWSALMILCYFDPFYTPLHNRFLLGAINVLIGLIDDDRINYRHVIPGPDSMVVGGSPGALLLELSSTARGRVVVESVVIFVVVVVVVVISVVDVFEPEA